jgi:amino acid permease
MERSPYACIAGEAMGNFGVVAVTLSQVITLFGVTIVFLLLSGINLNSLFPSHTPLF